MAEQVTLAPTPRKPKRQWVRSVTRLILLIVVPVIALGIGAHFYYKGGRYIETENAYVKANIIAISPDIDGRVVEVMVDDNQSIKPGAPLFRIDTAPFTLAVRHAEAKMDVVVTELESLRVDYQETVLEAANAREQIKYLERKFNRQKKLKDRKMGREDAYDAALNDLRIAKRQVRVIEERARRKLVSLGGDLAIANEEHPSYLEAKTARDQAALDLSRTLVRSPSTGIISNMRLQVGEYVEEGKAIFSILETEPLWVEANLKETQLTHVITGQRVGLKIDAYPDEDWAGVVAAIAPATGAEFSLLPPQNASGNWVKVVQRVPVKVQIDDARSGPELRAGMTVTVSIDTRRQRELPAAVKGWMTNEGIPEVLRGLLRQALAVETIPAQAE